mmetsp:Transcript_70549/g.200236  ORF Transcript_70549/g.200236 Transcript_70549/m.200236 type:complete len:403 (-) Transcript_70549:86-1294(-)
MCDPRSLWSLFEVQAPCLVQSPLCTCSRNSQLCSCSRLLACKRLQRHTPDGAPATAPRQENLQACEDVPFQEELPGPVRPRCVASPRLRPRAGGPAAPRERKPAREPGNGMRLHRKMHELPGLDELLPPVNDKSRSKSLSPFRFFDHSKTPQRERGGHQQDTSLNEYPLPIDLLTVLTDREAPEPRAPCAAFEEAPQGENPEKPLLAVKEAGTSPGRESTLPRPRSLRRSGRRSVSRKSRTRRCSASLRNILRTAGGERGAAEAWEDEAPAHERTVGATSYMPVLAADGLAAAGHPSRPGGGSWDWPLSRLDQKARLLMIDREMLLLEREEFLEQLQRASAAAAAAPVAGSASGAPRRSTGSSRARSRRSPKESPLLGGELQASPGKGTVQHSRAAVGIGGG